VKTTVTVLRASVLWLLAPIGDPQAEQKRASSVFSRPQLGHLDTRRV
jgi:hypothetical protein